MAADVRAREFVETERAGRSHVYLWSLADIKEVIARAPTRRILRELERQRRFRLRPRHLARAHNVLEAVRRAG